MCVNNSSKVALDIAAARIEPAISSRKFNALTTTPPSRTYIYIYIYALKVLLLVMIIVWSLLTWLTLLSSLVNNFICQ